MSTLADELPKQMARVRDQVMPAYQSIGDAGKPALYMMRQDLDRAAQALAEGDLAGMIICCKVLTAYKL